MPAMYRRSMVQHEEPVPYPRVMTFSLTSNGPDGDDSVGTATIHIYTTATEITLGAVSYDVIYGLHYFFDPQPSAYVEDITNVGDTPVYIQAWEGTTVNFSYPFDHLIYSDFVVKHENGNTLYDPQFDKDVEGWLRIGGTENGLV